MENTSLMPAKTSPKDFFLWLGAIIALYGSISFLITILFEYINYSFPDTLAGYSDPYGGTIRFAMASLIVMVPTTFVLLHLIRTSIVAEPAKANIWIRRWSLMLTLFLAALTGLIDLVTLINTFLGGEISERFALKVTIVLLIAIGVFLHFLADLKGYWITNGRKAMSVGAAVVLLIFGSIVSGFFIIGTPAQVRMVRFDDQKTQDLQNIQYQITTYYQQKNALPASLVMLNDPLTNFIVPTDPQTNAPYGYTAVNAHSFKLCAAFNKASVDGKGRGSTPMMAPTSEGGMSDVWTHEAGEQCFTRTIDPQKFPAYPHTKMSPSSL